MLTREVFSCFVHSVIILICSGSWVERNRSLFELVVKRRPFRVVDRSHGPLRALVIPKLVVSPWPGEFDSIQFDIAPRSSQLSSNVSAHSSSMGLVAFDEGVDLIAIGGRCDVVPVLTNLEICFLAVAKT